MAHTADAHHETHQHSGHGAHDLAAARKKYIKVFFGLIALTVIELIIVAIPMNKTLSTLLVAFFSSAKAVVVGYYYMHLESETRWLQIVACLPIIAFGYAFVLMADAPKRPISFYQNESTRVFRGDSTGHQESTGPEFASDLEKLDGEVLKIEAKSGRGGIIQPKVADKDSETSAPANPANNNAEAPAVGGSMDAGNSNSTGAPAAAPAAGSAEDWK
jgi:caa(3)-type oxidase subunit IV